MLCIMTISNYVMHCMEGRKKDNRKYNGFPLLNATSDRAPFEIPPFIMSWVSSSMLRECWNFRLWLTSAIGHGSINQVEMIWFSHSPLDYFKNGYLLDAKWGRALLLVSQALKFGSLKLKGICFLSRSMIVRVHDVCLFYEQHLEVNVMLVVRCCHE